MKEKRSRGQGTGKGSRVASVLCYIMGTAILLSVIISCLPVTLPRIIGYEIYTITSGSMEPKMPVGSIAYVDSTLPEDLAEGDIVAYRSGDGVITHRVVTNHTIEGSLTTKGDANADVDLTDVKYDQVVGKVVFHLPYLGLMMQLLSSMTGKVYAILWAACGVMFQMLGNVLKYRHAEK